MIISYIEKQNYEDTGFAYALSRIMGRYKTTILYCLMEFQVVRFNELKRYISRASDKTLSRCLKELENDGLIIRKDYKEIPPRVEYSLSKDGISLMKILDLLCDWGEEQMKKADKKNPLEKDSRKYH